MIDFLRDFEHSQQGMPKQLGIGLLDDRHQALGSDKRSIVFDFYNQHG